MKEKAERHKDEKREENTTGGSSKKTLKIKGRGELMRVYTILALSYSLFCSSRMNTFFFNDFE